MDDEYDLVDQMMAGQGMSSASHALRLGLAFPDGSADDMLMPQRISGTETICGGIDYQILCAAAGHDDEAAIAPNRDFKIDMSDGNTLKGISDAAGKTSLLQRDAMHIAKVRILMDKK